MLSADKMYPRSYRCIENGMYRRKDEIGIKSSLVYHQKTVSWDSEDT